MLHDFNPVLSTNDIYLLILTFLNNYSYTIITFKCKYATCKTLCHANTFINLKVGNLRTSKDCFNFCVLHSSFSFSDIHFTQNGNISYFKT